MNIKECLELGVKILKENNIEDARIKAKILLCFVLNIEKEYLLIKESEEIGKDFEEKFLSFVDKIVDGVPVQYITNKQEFMKLNFFVDENVLIPRADTEILVEEVISLASSNSKILDLCTGSGAIAISVAKYVSGSKVVASDISGNAIQIASKNARNNNVKVKFIESDLFEDIVEDEFDIIVSNPPYIKKNVINELNSDVRHEPRIALDGGNDGLDFYRGIAKMSKKFLKKDGYLCFEIGFDQKDDVINILKEEKYIDIYSKQDLSGNDRIVVGKKG